jgi:hypothetical protein
MADFIKGNYCNHYWYGDEMLAINITLGEAMVALRLTEQEARNCLASLEHHAGVGKGRTTLWWAWA